MLFIYHFKIINVYCTYEQEEQSHGYIIKEYYNME